MKKKYLFVTFITLILFVIVLKKNSHKERKNLEHTSKQLWELEFQKKKEKKSKGIGKTDKPDLFTEYFKAITTPIGALESKYKMNYKVKEFNKAQIRDAKFKSTKASLDWIERGPANVGGRTRALIVDPDDATHNTWYAGAASGGIWRTEDGGANWTNLSDQFTNLSVNAMTMAASNHDVIYAGTGESFPGGTGLLGNGVWKSIDRGVNWTQLVATSTDENFGYINRLIVDPTNEQIVIAATETGIYKSINGGSSWTEVYSSGSGVEDLVADPTSFNILFAGEHGNGVLRSTDAGDNWMLSSDGIGTGTRFELAVSSVDHNNVFVSVNVSNSVSNVYISNDNGLTWKKFNDTQAFLSAQGDYDNTIEAHPYIADEVFVGGVDIWKLKFSGTTEQSDPEVLKAYTVDTDFLTFINFSGAYLGGGLSIDEGTNLVSTDWTSVEIRFGVGLTQKAHRFTVSPTSGSNNDGGAGVEAADYQYQDYVDVPFQVWDMTNNKQLMVSFRDQEREGAYNLYERTGDAVGELGREYIFVNSIEYNASTPDANIIVNGGHLYKKTYMVWPVLSDGETWTPANLPTSKIVVEYGSFDLQNGLKTSIADSYGAFGGPNGYNQSAGFGNTSIPGLHPDHHNITIIPTVDPDFIIIDGNDGGLGISNDNGATFTMLPNNYITTQFYGVAKNPFADEYIGGMQDNGTWQSPSGTEATNTSNYLFRIGGDGFECLWHAENENLMLGSVYNNDIRKSINKGSNWAKSVSGILANDGPFVTRLSASKESPDLVFAVGNTGIYRSTNFGSSWSRKTISTNWSIDNTVSSSHNVEVSLANGNIVWAGGGMAASAGLQMQVSTNEGSTFSVVPNYSLVEMSAYTSGIATHPIDEETAYVLFSLQGKPKVLRTEDLGQTWEDISGFGTNSTSSNGFPDVVVHSLIVMPHDPNIIWVGTDIGLFESLDNGVSWNLANNGLPPVSVYDMQIAGNQVVVATHGRGIWTVDIPEIDNSPYIDEFTHVQSYNLNINTDLKVAYDSVQIYVNGVLNKSVISPTTGDNDISVTVDDEGTHEAYMIAYITDVPYKSNTIDVTFSLVSTEELSVSGQNIFTVYPNPSKGNVTLKFTERTTEDVYIQVYSLSGMLVYIEKAENAENAPELSLDLNRLKAGTYIVNIQSGEFKKTSKIIIK